MENASGYEICVIFRPVAHVAQWSHADMPTSGDRFLQKLDLYVTESTFLEKRNKLNILDQDAMYFFQLSRKHAEESCRRFPCSKENTSQ